MITKATRASFISLLQEMTGLISKEDVTTELGTRRIQRDNEDLEKIIKHILDTNNPFENNNASEICQSLLNVPTKGKARHKNFIDSCVKDANKFESPIKKKKLKTFEVGCTTNCQTKNTKIAALKGARDLMGRLLVLATK